MSMFQTQQPKRLVAASGRNVAANLWRNKSSSSKSGGSSKSKVVSNKKVPAQQFDVPVGRGQSSRVTLGFTKSNERFVGRAAMIGFAAALVGEIITGKGALQQLNIETGIPLTGAKALVAGIIVFNLLAAFLPGKDDNIVLEGEDAANDRKPGSLQDPKISLAQPKRFFGTTNFGFSWANEVFVGRVAQLGFAAAIFGEIVTGKGPLGQLGLEASKLF